MKLNRNGVTIETVQNVIKKGENAGTEYPAIPINTENLADVIKFIGEDEVANILKGKINQWCQGWNGEVLEEFEGSFNETAFQQLVEQMSARGESIKELLEQQMDLVDQLTKLDVASEAAEVGRIVSRLTRLKAAIGQKRRKTKEDKEAEATANV